jgi:hypothetical protein
MKPPKSDLAKREQYYQYLRRRAAQGSKWAVRELARVKAERRNVNDNKEIPK